MENPDVENLDTKLMDPKGSPMTPRMSHTTGLPCLLFSFLLSFIKIANVWTKPEMSDRKARYLTEGPVKKVSIRQRIKKQKKTDGNNNHNFFKNIYTSF